MSLPCRPDIYMDLKILSVLMDALLFVAELEDRALNKTKVTANSKPFTAGPTLQIVLHRELVLKVV